MNIFVTGSQEKIVTVEELDTALKQIEAEAGKRISAVVSDNSPGVDEVARAWAAAHRVPVKLFLINYKSHASLTSSQMYARLVRSTDTFVVVEEHLTLQQKQNWVKSLWQIKKNVVFVNITEVSSGAIYPPTSTIH